MIDWTKVIPALIRKDARRFEEEIKENEARAVSREEYERAAKVFNSVEELIEDLHRD